MHLLGQGIGRFILELIVAVNKSPDSQHIFHYTSEDGTPNTAGYTFKAKYQELLQAGRLIETSRGNVPVSFQGSWDNLILSTKGARAIDFLDFLLYVVPTLLVPLFKETKVRTALLNLVRGCAIALQWKLNDRLIHEMET